MGLDGEVPPQSAPSVLTLPDSFSEQTAAAAAAAAQQHGFYGSPAHSLSPHSLSPPLSMSPPSISPPSMSPPIYYAANLHAVNSVCTQLNPRTT